MNTLNFWEILRVPNSVVKKDEQLEAEKEKLTKEFEEKGKKQMEALDGPILEAFQAFERARVLRNVEKIQEHHGKYQTLLRQKLSMREDVYRAVEKKTGEQEGLITDPDYRDRARQLIDQEEKNLMKSYVAFLPDYRTAPGSKDRELPVRGFRQDPDSPTHMMEIETNGPQILEAKRLLINARCRVMQCRRVATLKKVLDELQGELAKIDLNPVKVEVEEEEFVRLDRPELFETATLVGDKVFKHK